MKATAFFVSMLMTMLPSAAVSAQQKPTTGYAPVNGLKMYYEIHGEGDPLVLLHGAFMTITSNWTAPWGNEATDWIAELSKTRKVIAVEMQGHGRTADIDRDISPENLADDVSALLDYLKIPKADILGYSLGGGAAMQCAIRHPGKVRKVVIISYAFRSDGWVKEKNDAMQKLTPEAFKGSPIETEYKKLNPTPDKFGDFVNHIKAAAVKPYDFGADKFKATKAPMFFIFGDADGVRLDHIAEMVRLKGGEVSGDLGPRSESRLAILPDTTHVALMFRMSTIVPMVNDFLNAKPSKQLNEKFDMNVQEQIKKYIASQPEPKRSDMQALHLLTLQVLPECKLWFLDGKDSEGKTVSNPNIGYGLQTIKYADGKTREFYQIGLSANKTGISVYILGIKNKKYLAQTYGKKLGKASVTGYCIRFKTLKDINIDVLEAAMRYGFEATE